MHSRLFVISESNKIMRQAEEADFVDNGFVGCVADYVGEVKGVDEMKEDIVDWFFNYLKNHFEGYIEVNEKNFSFKVKKGTVKKIFEDKIDKMIKTLEEKQFSKDTREYRHLFYEISEIMNDTTGFYLAFVEECNVSYYTLDDFLQWEYNEDKTYYINQVFDYHC